MVTGKADLVVKNHGGAAVLRIRVPLRQGIRLRRPIAGKMDPSVTHAVFQDMCFLASASTAQHAVHIMEDKGDFRRMIGHVRPNHKRRFPTEKIGVDRSSALCGLTAHNLQDWLADQGIDIKGIGLFLIGIRL